jgi:HEAT repeat protein
MEESTGEWFNTLPCNGRIYRLIEEAGDVTNTQNRLSAMNALGTSGDPRAVRRLVACCSDPDPVIRLHATEALLKLRSGRAVDALVGRLKDKNEQPVIRQRAADALATIRSYSAIEGLKDRSLDAEEDPLIRSYVAEIMDHSGTL